MFRVLALAIVLFTIACTVEPDRSYWFIESYHDGTLKVRLHEGSDKSTTYTAVCDAQNGHVALLKVSRITEPNQRTPAPSIFDPAPRSSPAPSIPDPTPRISPAPSIPDSAPRISPTLPFPYATTSGCDIAAGFVGKGFLVESQGSDFDAAVIITILTTRGEPGGGAPGDDLILHGKRGGFSASFRIVSVTR